MTKKTLMFWSFWISTKAIPIYGIKVSKNIRAEWKAIVLKSVYFRFRTYQLLWKSSGKKKLKKNISWVFAEYKLFRYTSTIWIYSHYRTQLSTCGGHIFSSDSKFSRQRLSSRFTITVWTSKTEVENKRRGGIRYSIVCVHHDVVSRNSYGGDLLSGVISFARHTVVIHVLSSVEEINIRSLYPYPRAVLFDFLAQFR